MSHGLVLLRSISARLGPHDLLDADFGEIGPVAAPAETPEQEPLALQIPAGRTFGLFFSKSEISKAAEAQASPAEEKFSEIVDEVLTPAEKELREKSLDRTGKVPGNYRPAAHRGFVQDAWTKFRIEWNERIFIGFMFYIVVYFAVGVAYSLGLTAQGAAFVAGLSLFTGPFAPVVTLLFGSIATLFTFTGLVHFVTLAGLFVVFWYLNKKTGIKSIFFIGPLYTFASSYIIPWLPHEIFHILAAVFLLYGAPAILMFSDMAFGRSYKANLIYQYPHSSHEERDYLTKRHNVVGHFKNIAYLNETVRIIVNNIETSIKQAIGRYTNPISNQQVIIGDDANLLSPKFAIMDELLKRWLPVYNRNRESVCQAATAVKENMLSLLGPEHNPTKATLKNAAKKAAVFYMALAQKHREYGENLGQLAYMQANGGGINNDEKAREKAARVFAEQMILNQVTATRAFLDQHGGTVAAVNPESKRKLESLVARLEGEIKAVAVQGRANIGPEIKGLYHELLAVYQQAIPALQKPLAQLISGFIYNDGKYFVGHGQRLNDLFKNEFTSLVDKALLDRAVDELSWVIKNKYEAIMTGDIVNGKQSQFIRTALEVMDQLKDQESKTHLAEGLFENFVNPALSDLFSQKQLAQERFVELAGQWGITPQQLKDAGKITPGGEAEEVKGITFKEILRQTQEAMDGFSGNETQAENIVSLLKDMTRKVPSLEAG
ncbi:MAG: hypothetical protein HGA76_11700, partial [Candidatus Firestonebacteria bacterium]|nr:hypothetical protein [Candidatus Firestonebacteria bacterium]